MLDFHGRPAPVVIVRPSLISALAGKPYPGYVGNLAGVWERGMPSTAQYSSWSGEWGPQPTHTSNPSAVRVAS